MINKTSFRIWAWGHLFFLVFGFIAAGAFVFFAWIPAIVISCVAYPFFVVAAKAVSRIPLPGYVKVAAMALFSLLITGLAFHLCGGEHDAGNAFSWQIDHELRGLYYASLAATLCSNIICYRAISTLIHSNIQSTTILQPF